MLYMTAFMLSLKYLYGFVRIYPAGITGVVISDKAGERLPNDKTHVQRLAGIRA
jgi:hypothetical protein